MRLNFIQVTPAFSTVKSKRLLINMTDIHSLEQVTGKMDNHTIITFKSGQETLIAQESIDEILEKMDENI